MAAAPAATSPLPHLPGTGCRVCGAQPVADVTLRAHQAFLILMWFRSLDGPFCRNCGITMHREMTTRTLWQGWWGPFSLLFGVPFALLANLRAYLKIKQLGPPAAATGRPLVEVEPVLRRPAAYVALIPLCWAVWFATGLITHAG
ncbi:hypothetical protein ABZS96_25950 [Streptomyces avermitilis]|uniref:hypothetical protein n=1 Tax=Streptomyces avermitilis TaxID=33903 RepID=UPI0033A6427A